MNEDKNCMDFQPCWNCAKCFGGCSWSRDFIPVDGWKATPTIKRNTNHPDVESYQIEYCPEFEPDKPIDPQAINDDGCARFLAAYFKAAANDYRAALRTYFRMQKYLDSKSDKAMRRNVNLIGECFTDDIAECLRREVLNDSKAMA